jgi:serine/threonine protein kinase
MHSYVQRTIVHKETIEDRGVPIEPTREERERERERARARAELHASVEARLAPFCQKLVDADIATYVDIAGDIGEGGYGKLYFGRATDEGVRVLGLPADINVALKIQRLSPLTINEVSLLRELDLPHVPKMYGCFSDGRTLTIIMEQIVGKDIMNWITNSKVGLSRKQLIKIFTEIAETLLTLHAEGIYHRDVKPENIMFSPFKNKAYLVDFGVSCRLDGCTRIGGTVGYLDPLLYEKAGGDYEADELVRGDWWSFLVTAYSSFTASSPFTERTQRKFRRAGLVTDLELDLGKADLVPAGLMSIIERCLRDPLNIDVRPTGDEIIHSFS